MTKDEKMEELLKKSGIYLDNELFILVKSGMSITDLAAKSGVSRGTIHRLISADTLPREVRLETLDRIAAPLGYKVKVIFEEVHHSNIST